LPLPLTPLPPPPVSPDLPLMLERCQLILRLPPLRRLRAERCCRLLPP